MTYRNGDVVSATVRRWQLTETLRQLREQRGLTLEQAAGRLRERQGQWSRSKLSRVETREQKVRAPEVEQLLDFYEVTDVEVRLRVLDLAAGTDDPGYWSAIRKDLPRDFHEFLEVEAELVALRQFETMLIPGLLQTADYTRALIRGASPGLASDVVERRVVARMSRQQVLTRAEPLRFHAILDEAILERPVGASVVMRNQLRRLIDEAATDHVTIQVLAKSVGASPALDGPFSLLSLPDPIPDFGYVEGPGGAVYLDDRDDVRNRLRAWDILTERALSESGSVELITKAMEGCR